MGAGWWMSWFWKLLEMQRLPKYGFEDFSIGWTVYIPDSRDGDALGYLLFLPAIWGTSGVRIWWRLGCLGVFNHYYYYLIVHLLWYWAGQLGSGADPPWPWAGACPALAASSSCKASPPETSPPGRRATVGILLADGGFPGYIYIIIVITIIVIIIFCCCCCRFFRLKNLLQLSPRW